MEQDEEAAKWVLIGFHLKKKNWPSQVRLCLPYNFGIILDLLVLAELKNSASVSSSNVLLKLSKSLK